MQFVFNPKEGEYESRTERYDKQLKEGIGVDPSNKTREEKIALVRAYRENRYEQLPDAVYERREWTSNGVPKPTHLKNIGMDIPELLEVVLPLQEN